MRFSLSEVIKPKIQPVHTPIDCHDVRKLVEKKGSLAAQQRIIKVEFTTIKSFSDPNQSNFCLVVSSSNGLLGTLTHLQVNANIQEFADNLLTIYKGSVAAICLSGASNGGEKLLDDTFKALKQRGFRVSLDTKHSNTGGSTIYRRATLYPDRVHVSISPYSGKKSELVLTFPK